MAGIVKFMTGTRANYEAKYPEGNLEGVLFFSTDDYTIWKDGHLYGQASQGDASWDEIKNRYDGAFVQILKGTNNGQDNNGYTFSFVNVKGDSTDSISIPLASAAAAGVMSSTDYSKLAGIDADNIVYKEEGKGLSSNDYTNAEKEKLAGIEEGAQVNIIQQVKVDGTALTVTDKSVNIPLSEKIGEVVGSKLTTAYNYKGSVSSPSALPTSGQSIGDVYNILTASDYGAAGVNVAWTGSEWDSLGGIFDTTAIDNKISEIESNVTNLTSRVDIVEPKVNANTQAITILNGDDSTVGSVSYTSTNIANTVVTEYLKWEELN